MAFEKDKQNALNKLDKSKKRSIDKNIKQLVDLLNSKPDYYTTSSCAGRIVLISFPENNRKYNVKWLFLSHNTINFKTIKDNIANIIKDFKKNNNKNDVWLKGESSIIHICCKTLEDASELIEIAKHIGFKRSGINTMGKRIMLELISTENIDALIIKNKQLLVDDTYLKILVKEANKKLKKTHEKIKRLYQELSS